MSSGDIAFPNLHIYLTDVPKGFTVFGFFIAFYAVFIVTGMLLGGVLADRLARKSGESGDLIWDFFLYAIFFSVLGARIYYVIFAWDFYKDNWLSILNIRQGGLAIYGGVIAAFLTLWVYSRIKKIHPWRLGDYCMPGLILGQAIGRWGNFTNREVFGEYTDNLFAMRLPITDVRARDISEALASHIGAGENFIQVHPTFLYESAWNLLVFILLLLYFSHRKFDGEICLLYLGGYGLGRFFIEGIRTDTLFLTGTQIPVSQVVAVAAVLVCIVVECVGRARVRAGKR